MLERAREYVKKNSFSLIYALVIILIILGVYNIYQRLMLEQMFLEGLWVAGEDYCQSAEITGMFLYIGPSVGWSNIRQAYLIMHNNDIVIVNRKFSISLCRPYQDYINPFIGNAIKKNLCIIDEKDTGIEDAIEDPSEISMSSIMPAVMSADIDFAKGRMVWYDAEGQVYAELYKDHALTQAEKGKKSE